jgi:nicotinate-nucleotide adenylyltransferase
LKVAVFGGSFDPPHIGHEEIIKKSLRNLDIEALFVVPTFLNPFKKSSFAPAKIRLRWVKKLLLPYEKAKIITYEIDRGEPVPTIETIKYLKQEYDLDEIYLIIGADNLESLPKWKDFRELKKLVRFVVATRGDIEIDKSLKILEINVNISSTNLRDLMDKKFIPSSIQEDVTEYYKERKRELLIEKIVRMLDEKKAENIEVFDMSEKDYFVDSVIIASTKNKKHGHSLTDHLKKELKSDGILDIESSDEWSVIDMGDLLIHLISPEYRARYNLEEFLTQREKRE